MPVAPWNLLECMLYPAFLVNLNIAFLAFSELLHIKVDVYFALTAFCLCTLLLTEKTTSNFNCYLLLKEY